MIHWMRLTSGRLLRLDHDARRALAGAWLALLLVSLGLRTVRLARLTDMLARLHRSEHSSGSDPERTVALVTWAVARASAYVPGSTCLVRALAARVLLARMGIPVSLELGVAVESDGRVRGHAWIEQNGTVLLGGDDDPGLYVRLGISEHRSIH